MEEVAINTIESTELNVFPNPFIDKISLRNKSANESIQLVDIKGQTMYEGIDIEKQDFSYLSKGIYFLKIKNKTIKIIKE